MKRKLRKGFTIVELVIVIAVIAILAAILIPTFVNLSRKAKVVSDQSLVANLNTALKMEQGETGKTPKTMYDAVQGLKNQGYYLPQLVTKSGEELVYSIEQNKFLLSNEVADGEEYKYWHIEKGGMPESQKYSIYAYKWDDVTAVSNLKVGFDAGEETKIASVSYDRSGESTSRTVVIRTNGGTLTINDTNDDSEQLFYGYADAVVVSTGNHCFTAHGAIGTMNLQAGKAVADKGAFIGLIEAAAGTVALEQNGGVFVIPAGTTTEDIDATVAQSIGYTVSGSEINATPEKEALSEAKAEEFAEQALNDENDNIVAIVGSKKYDSLKDAVEAAQNGEKILLLNDAVINESIGSWETVEVTDDEDEGGYSFFSLKPHRLGGGSISMGGDEPEYEDVFTNCIVSEVKLMKDIILTFTSDNDSWINMILRENGLFNLNGHQLKINADCDVFIETIQANLDFTAKGSNLVLNENLVYTQGSSYALVFDGTWRETSFIRGSHISGQTMEVEYQEVYFKLFNGTNSVDIESPYEVNMNVGQTLNLNVLINDGWSGTQENPYRNAYYGENSEFAAINNSTEIISLETPESPYTGEGVTVTALTAGQAKVRFNGYGHRLDEHGYEYYGVIWTVELTINIA